MTNIQRKVVISLCDLTGNFTKPWSDAGYDVVLVDPQHETSRSETLPNGATIHRLALTVEDAMDVLGIFIRNHDVAFVAGWPVCTDMAGSGARWWKDKAAVDPHFQTKAVMLAEQCRTIGRLSGAPWFVENPVGMLRRVFGRASFTFNPYDYTALEPSDNYSKRTCLWAGGGFVMPDPERDVTLGAPDNRIHFASPGADRANFRSATPMGFARAVFNANHTS